MLNQFAVEIPTLPIDRCLSHHIQNHFVSPCRKEGPPSIWTHMVFRETYPLASSSAPYPQELNQWSTTICLQRRKVKDQNKIEI